MTACPSTEVLRRFLEEDHDAGMSTETARHIDRCQQCQSKLDQLTEASFALGVPDSSSSTDHSGLDLSQILDNIRAGQRSSDERSCDERSRDERSSDERSCDERSRDELGSVETPPPEASRLPAGQLPGYTFLSHIGSGTGGDVFRARDEQLGRIVAVKVLKPELAARQESLARFEREARAAAALENEHIVRLHALCESKDFPPCLVFEYVEGESLKERLQREEAIAPQEAARIAVAVASGLTAAHRVGVIHRDIKPSNILIEKATDRVKIADFGLARFSEMEADITVEGTLAGTPNYMSPEQIRAPQSVDARSDFYSVGVLLYEMLAGVVPYRGPLRMVLQRRIHEDPQPPRLLNDAVPRDLETICLKAMSREPTRRYQTGEEFIDDVARWQEGRPILARPVGVIEKAWRWSRRNPTVAQLSVLVLMLVLAGFVGMSWFTIWLADSKRNAELLSRQSNEHARQYEIQRDLAVKYLDQMVHEVQNELAERPETRQLRNRLLDIAMQGLDEVQQTGEFSLTGAVGTADALNRLGELARELGELKEAKAHFQDAHDRLQELLGHHSHENDIKQAMAMTLCNLGDVQGMMGEKEFAESQYHKAINLLRQAAVDDAGNRPLADRGLAIAHERLGDLFRKQERWTEALQHYATSAQIVEAQHAHDDRNSAARRDWAVIIQKQGAIELRLNHLSAAAELLKRGHRLFQELMAQDAGGFRSRRDVAVSFSRLAEVKQLQKKTQDAYDDLRESSRLLDELARQDPDNLGLLRDLAATCSRLGEMAFALMLSSDAERHFTSAVALYERVIATENAFPEDHQDLKRCLANLRAVANQDRMPEPED